MNDDVTQLTTGRKIAWVVSLLMLACTGVLGLLNGVSEWDDPRTALQRSVTGGVLLYGVLGVAAGIAMAMRHPSSVPLCVLWGVVVTYVASTAALAYAGEDATLVGGVASGIASALIALGVVWSARISVRESPRVVGRRSL